MNNIKLCPKCKAVNIPLIKKELAKTNKEITYEIGCLSFCGIGMTKAFAVVNNNPIVCNNNEELITKIKEVLK